MNASTATYIDCPSCQRSTLAEAVTQHLADVGLFSRRYAGLGAGHIADCAECGTTSVVPSYRRIAIGRSSARRRRQCDAVCITGKRSCDCRCQGRCHGAGACYCGTGRVSDAARSRAIQLLGAAQPELAQGALL